MDASPKRLRVNGTAMVAFDDPMLADFVGAEALIKMRPEHVFPNCPRYIHDAGTGSESICAPPVGVPPTVPAWKSLDSFGDVVAPRKA